MFNIGNKFNRSYLFNIEFDKEKIDLTVLFNNDNLYTGYQVDQKTYLKTKNSNCSCIIFFDIKKSNFANTFLDMSDIKTNNCDIKNKYNCVYTQYKNIINCEFNESIRLSKINIRHEQIENYLNISLFRFTTMDSSFLYCLSERQWIDPVIQKKIVRTSAYQLQTNESAEYLSRAVCKYSPKKKVINTTDEIIESLVSDDSNSLKKKRGGLL